MRDRAPHRPRTAVEARDRVQAAPDARAALALELQRSAGNQLVARLLAREAAVEAPPRPALKSGQELDTMLLASAFFKPYVEPKIKQGTKAEGHVHMHDPETFKDEVLKHLRGKENPKTRQTFTAEEAAKFETTVRAFQDDAGDIRVSEKRADNGTVIHEAMHLFCSPAFVDAVGYHVNEGATEVFARRLASENSILRAGFPTQHRLVGQLVTHTSETLLANAYFNNDLQPLIDRLDRKKGAGSWAKWLAAMQAGEFEEADGVI